MELTVEHGCFAWPGGREVIRDVSFAVGSGEVLAVLGPNGAGKTTLLRCVMGLLRWKSGKSALDGKDIREFSTRELWSRIAYVPQAKRAGFDCTVEEMLLLGRGSRIGAFSSPGREDLQKVRAVSEKLGIAGLAERRCSCLSGGELQMVLLGRALVAEPQVLVLDEPESNLDFRNQLLVLDAISSLAADGMTCVFNTHYPDHALGRASHALLMTADGNYRFGPAAQIVTADNIRASFGVDALVRTTETPEKLLHSVVPVRVSVQQPLPNDGNTPEERVIAVIAILTRGHREAPAINALLHDYSGYLIGRMGLPCRTADVNVINCTLDAPMQTVRELTDRLAMLPGVSVKATSLTVMPSGKGAKTEA